MELEQLEKLIDETNIALLAGAPTKIHEMSIAELTAFMEHIEKLYRNCLKIKHSQHQKVFKVGLNFDEYAKAIVRKEKKNVEKKGEGGDAPKEKKSKKPSILSEMNISLTDIQATIANFCMEHKTQKAQCGCP